jgi:hypothetical protein
MAMRVRLLSMVLFLDVGVTHLIGDPVRKGPR